MASGLLGRLSVIVTADTRQLVTGLQNASRETKHFGKATNQILLTLGSRFTGVLASATLAVGALGQEMSQVGIEFEKAVTTLGAIQGRKLFDFAPNADFNEAIRPLANAARELGATTTFTATEAAEAMQALARAGLGTSEIIGTVGAALNFAGANATTLDKSTALLAATMAQFNLSSKDSVRITDTFTVALQNSLLDVRSLTVAMRYAGTIGSTLGMSLEQTTAAIALFRDLGLEGSTAGTQFRQAMLALTNPTEKAKKTLKRLNLTVQDINPSIHGFEKVLRRLGEENLTLAEITELVSKRAAGSVATIAMQFESGASKYTELLQKFATEIGVTEQTYKRSVDNVFSNLKMVQSASEELAITLFSLFAEDLNVLLAGLQKFIVRLGNAFKLFGKLVSRELDVVRQALIEVGFDQQSSLIDGITTAFIKLVRVIAKGTAAIIRGFETLKQIGKVLIIIFTSFFSSILAGAAFNTIASGIKLIDMALIGLGKSATFASRNVAMLMGSAGLLSFMVMASDASPKVKALAAAVNGLAIAYGLFRTAVASSNANIVSAIPAMNKLRNAVAGFAFALSMMAGTSLPAVMATIKGAPTKIGKVTTAVRVLSVASLTFLKNLRLSAILAIPHLKALVVGAALLTAAYKGYKALFSDSVDTIEREARLFREAQENAQAGFEGRQLSSDPSAIRNLLINTNRFNEVTQQRLTQQGKMNSFIKQESNFLRDLTVEQAKALVAEGKLIRIRDEATGSIVLMSAELALALERFDDNTSAIDQMVQKIELLGRSSNNFADQAIAVGNLSTDMSSFSNVTQQGVDAIVSLDSSLSGLSRVQLQNSLSTMESEKRTSLLVAAQAQLAESAKLVGDQQRAAQSNLASSDLRLRKHTVNVKLNALEQQRLNKAMADQQASEEMVRKLDNARKALDKFRASLQEALLKAQGEERTAKAMKQLRKLDELNKKVEKLEKASIDRRLQQERDYRSDVETIITTEELKLAKKQEKLSAKIVNERQKLGNNQLDDFRDEFDARLDKINAFEKDRVKLLNTGLKAEKKSFADSQELEIKNATRKIRNTKQREQAIVDIKDKFRAKEVKRDLKHEEDLSKVASDAEAARIENKKLFEDQKAQVELESLRFMADLRARAEEEDKSPLIALRRQQKLHKAEFDRLHKHLKKKDKLRKEFEALQRRQQKNLERDLVESNILIAGSLTDTFLALKSAQIGGGDSAIGSFFGSLAQGIKTLADLQKELTELELKFRANKEQMDKNTKRSLVFAASLKSVVLALASAGSKTQILNTALVALAGILLKASFAPLIAGLAAFAETSGERKGFDKIVKDINEATNKIAGAADGSENMIPMFVDAAVKSYEFLKEKTVETVDFLIESFSKLGDPQFWKGIAQAPIDFYYNIKDVFKDTAGTLAKVGTAFTSAGGGAAGFKAALSALGAAGTAVLGVFAAVLAVIVGLVAAVTEGINLGKRIPALLQNIANKFNDFFTLMTGGETLNIFDVVKNGVNEVVRAMDDTSERIEEMRRLLDEGRISAEQFDEAMSQMQGAGGREAAAREFVQNLVSRSTNFIETFGAIGSIIITEFTSAIPTLFSLIRTNAASLFQSLAANAPQFFAQVISNAGPLLAGLANTIASALPSLVNTISSLLGTVIPQFFTQIGPAIQNLFESIMSSLPKLVQSLAKALPFLLGAMRTVTVMFAQFMAKLIPMFIGDILPTLIDSALFTFTEKGIAALKKFGAAFRKAIPNLIPLIERILTQLVPFVGPLIGLILDIAIGMVDLVGLLIPQIVELAVAFIVAIGKEIPTIIAILIEKLPELVLAIGTAILTTLSFLINDLINSLSKMLTDFFAPILNFMGMDTSHMTEDPTQGMSAEERDAYHTREMHKNSYNQFMDTMEEIFSLGTAHTETYGDTPGAILAGSEGLAARFAAGDYVVAAQQPMDVLRQALQLNSGMLQGLAGPALQGASAPIDIAIMAEGRLLDAVQVRAMDRGNAPRMEKRIRRSGGANIGFSRGRFNKYGA